MSTIWKFSFAGKGTVITPSVPTGAKILSVDIDPATGEDPALWAEVDPFNEQEKRTFVVVGTGHPLSFGHKHIGSVTVGPFALHVFERTAS
jgi:hypothetical protein